MLTYGTNGHNSIFPWIYGLVIWSVAPHVCSAVHQPACIEHHSVSQKSRNKISHSQGFAPEVPGHQRGDKEAEQHDRQLVVPKGEQRDNVESHKASHKHVEKMQIWNNVKLISIIRAEKFYMPTKVSTARLIDSIRATRDSGWNNIYTTMLG